MILILGGGLAGLSTAYHLGQEPHLVLEGEADAGGLCRSREIDGYVFDYTGHLLHLRDPRMIAFVEELAPGVFHEVERQAEVRMRGARLPFPFQANLHGLPKELVADALIDFVEALGTEVPTDPRTSFEDWSLAVFGRGISDLFMLPYNEKLFRREPRRMTADWVSWAVPRPSLRELVRGALGIPNEGMGYNPKFRYPAAGGIGVLPARLAERVENVRYSSRVVGVNLDDRTVRLADGEVCGYDRLVVTNPLPEFLAMTEGGPAGLHQAAAKLDWSVVGCVNLGIERPEIADGAHWIYLPDDDVPFYRVGFPSNFSEGVAPAGTSAAYVEFGLRRDEPFRPEELERQALAGLKRLGMIDERDRVPVVNTIKIDPGYVIFDRDRQDVMDQVVPALERCGVHLIGRYGAWTYSYMERAMLDGLELAGTLTAQTQTVKGMNSQTNPTLAVRIEGLSKAFKGHLGIGRTAAVSGLDLEVGTGEAFGLLGPNGAGKTTTLKMMIGLLRPDAGTIRLLGRPPSDPAARARIGYLPENPYFYDYLTAREFLDFYARLQGIPSSERGDRVQQTLTRVGLKGREKTALRKFSKGMVQRLGLAQAIQHDPDLVILDEPMSGLDPVGRREVRDLILSLRDAGKTVFFSSHILQDAEMICDRVAILKQGQRISCGKLHDMVSDTVKFFEISVNGSLPDGIKVERVSGGGKGQLIRVHDVTDLGPTLAAIQEAGCQVLSVWPRKDTLEDLFMREVEAEPAEKVG